MTWRRWTVLFDLLRVGLRKPAALVGALRMEHVRTLLYAVRHEPPSLILHNFRRLLTQGSGVFSTLVWKVEIEGIAVHLEHKLLLPGRIEVKGWYSDPHRWITDIHLNGDGTKVGTMTLGLDRPDLEQRYGRHLSGNGFHGLFPIQTSVGHWQIVLEKTDGVTIHCPIPDYSAENRYKEWSHTDKDFRLTPRQIRRRISKIRLPELRLYLSVTPTQFEILRDDNLPCIILDHIDDLNIPDLIIRLHPDSVPQSDLIWQVVEAFERSQRSANLIYWDEDVIDDSGERSLPQLKPRWNPEYLLSWNYIGQDFAYRSPYQDSRQFKHPLEVVTATKGKVAAAHLPMVLSHKTRPRDFHAREEHDVRQAFLKKHYPKARLQEGLVHQTWRIKYPYNPDEAVTIIVPFKDRPDLLKTCIESVERFTRYPSFRWLLVNNQSSDPETLKYLENLRRDNRRAEIIDFNEPFNFARLHNHAMDSVKTPYVLLMNNDIQATHEGWLESMMEHAQRAEVGAVGALLTYPDDTIQHAGVLVGIWGAADHAFKYLSIRENGYGMRAQVVQQLSAVTAACMLMRTELYIKAGGMDEKNFTVAFNDVDLCLKLRKMRYTILFTPYSRLVHTESATRGIDSSQQQRDRARREIRAFQDRWRLFLKEGDPFYHPMCSISSGHYEFRG